MIHSKSSPPSISFATHTSAEQTTAHLLHQLCETYSLNKWKYTEHVQIDEDAIPHSHPILTLNTEDNNDLEKLLATYIHEQIHWFLLLEKNHQSSNRVFDAFKQRYPDLPIKRPQGCGSEFSNYLHIQVNYLEHLALVELLGKERADTIALNTPHYTKIYELIVRENEYIGNVMRQYHLIPDSEPPQIKNFIDVAPPVSPRLSEIRRRRP